MKTIRVAVVVAGVVGALALTGCPPSETTGTATTTGTAVTTAAAEVGGAGSAAAVPGEAEAMQKGCEAVFDKMNSCAADFLPMLVETRVKLDVPAGIAEKGKDEAGKKALAETAKTEWDADYAKKGEFCAKMIKEEGEMMKAEKANVDACLAKTDCKEFVTCWAPIEERHMAGMKAKAAAGAAGAAPASAAPAAPAK